MARQPRIIAQRTIGGNVEPTGDNRGNPNVGDGTSVEATDSSSSVIEPASVAGLGDGTAGDGGSGEPRKRRTRSDAGRRRGAKPEANKTILELGSLAEILSETHSMLAAFTGTPELILDENAPHEEHVKLARAIERVARHYDIPSMSPKAFDWMMLCKTLSLIYGPRIMAIHLRLRAERAKPVARSLGAAPQAPVPAPMAPSAGPAAPPKPAAPANAPGMPVDDLTRTVVIPGLEHMGSVTVKLNS